MLSRKLPGRFVCLRCQLQQINAYRGPLFLRIPALANSTALSRRRYGTAITGFHDEAPERAIKINWSNFDDSGDLDFDTLEDTLGFEESREVRDFLKKDPLARRVFQAQGEKLPLRKEDISFDILSEAAHTILLRRGGKWARQSRSPLEEAPQAVQQLDIVTVLERDNVDPELAEIVKNIHDLQPLKTRVLPDVSFEALKLILLRGFALEQLRGYIHYYTTLAVDFEKGTGPPWIIHRSLWKPQRAEEVPVGASADTVDAVRNKEQLVGWLVDECWALIPESKQGSQGYIDIILRDVEFGLLIAGNKRWLNQVSRYFKGFAQQIELHPSANVLRLVATKAVAEAMLEEINEILRLTKTVSHNLDLISDQHLNPTILAQVGQITNSVVKLDPSGKQITISWIHKVNRLDDVEDLGDVVIRFLLAAFGPKRHATTVLAAQPGFSLYKGRYIVDYDNTARLPWKDRERQWARWVSSTTKRNHSQHVGEIPAKVVEQLVAFENKSEKRDNASPYLPSSIESSSTPQAEDVRAGWSRGVLASTRAVFGHVLHSPKLPSGEVLTAQTTKLETSFDHSFIPVLPPLTSLQFDKYSHRDRPRHCTLLLHFLPAPDQDHTLSQASPPLELRLEVDGDELRQVLSLRAVVDSFTANVMYPQRPVDVRITQQQYYEIIGTDMQSGQPHATPVLDFINSSTLQVKSGNLHTPPRLVGLYVPQRLLRQEGWALTLGKDSDNGPGLVKVDYRFSGLEIHHAVAAKYGDYTLWYKQVEAGQHGGNWSELALSESSPDDLTPCNYQAEAFLQAISQLICEQDDFRWQDERKNT